MDDSPQIARRGLIASSLMFFAACAQRRATLEGQATDGRCGLESVSVLVYGME